MVKDIKTALLTVAPVACFGRSGFYFYTYIKQIGQCSLQARLICTFVIWEMFTQYLVLACICDTLWKILSTKLTNGYTLQMMWHFHLEKLNAIFTHA